MQDDEKLVSHVSRLVSACVSYRDEQEPERNRAQEYYNGIMEDLPATKNRSSAVSSDVRSTIKKILPSVMRTLLGNDRIVEFHPVGQEDEEAAQQASDYVNVVVVPECDAEKAIYDAVHDALLVKTGIIKWSAYSKAKAEVYSFTDISNDQMLGLDADDDTTIIEHEEIEETDQEVLALDPNARRHNVKLRRVTNQVEPKLEAIPRGRFLITPNADSIEEAEVVGEEYQITRSDLVAMGYDAQVVAGLASIDSKDDEGDRTSMMGEDATSEAAETMSALEEVQVFEIYVKMDTDGDGIAELHRIVYGERGGNDEDTGTNNVLLAQEPVSEAPYADIVSERDPHQFEGHSIFEDAAQTMRVKTALLRSALNNTYANANIRPAVDTGAVVDPEALMNGKLGEPIQLKPGKDVRAAIRWDAPPFIAQAAIEMMSVMDEEAKDRHGITDASGGLDASSITNVNNGVAMMAAESGIAQADMMVRTIARGGLKKAFRGLLRLVIAHTDRKRTIKMRGEWVEYDPRVWNSEMDCSINVGLGGGSKERDFATLSNILNLQERLLTTMGADNPFVKPRQLYNTLEKMTETAGFPSADPYFTEPDEQEIAAKLKAQAEQPSPEDKKLQAQVQLEQVKMKANRDKENAQMQADLQVKEAEIAARSQENAEKLALQRDQDAQQERLALAKIDADLQMHREKMTADVQKEQAKHLPDFAQ